MFAGDASKLYLLSGSTWNDVSRTSGGPYAPGGDNLWRFTQFGTLAIAVNGVDAPQKFDLGVGTNWTALGGSPPVGTFITTVRDFVVMGKIGSAPQRVQWSGFNNAETWGTSLSTQADLQDLPDGGNVTGLVGGEVGLIFQETSVRRMTYEGPPVIFRIDKIANDIGASVPGSVAGLLDMAFFLHKSGFYMVRAGQAITPIGRGKVDRTFWAEFDEANHFRSSSAIDPVRGLYVFAYPANGSNGTPNRLLIYNWHTGRWTRAILDCELVFGGVSQQAYTLEQLDPFGTLETLPYSLEFVVLDGRAVPAAVRLRHVASQRLVLRTDALGHRGDGESSIPPPAQGNRSIIRACRPLIDGGSPQIQIGARETQQQSAVSYAPPIGLTAAGLAPVYSSGRYFRVRATQPAGAVWSNMQGIDDLDVRPAGAMTLRQGFAARPAEDLSSEAPQERSNEPARAARDRRHALDHRAGERADPRLQHAAGRSGRLRHAVCRCDGARWLAALPRPGRLAHDLCRSLWRDRHGLWTGRRVDDLQPARSARPGRGRPRRHGRHRRRPPGRRGHQPHDPGRRRWRGDPYARTQARCRRTATASTIRATSISSCMAAPLPRRFTGRAGDGDGSNQYFQATNAAATGISIQNAGGGGAHNNTQPTLILNYVIAT